MNLVSDDEGKENPIVFTTVFKWLIAKFEDYQQQRQAFNHAVIAFCLMLKHGFHPWNIVVFQISLFEIVEEDKDFTSVAWQLALRLYGWDILHPPKTWVEADGKTDDFERMLIRLFRDDGGNNRGTDGELTYSTEEQDPTVSTDTGNALADGEGNEGEESDDERPVPGAWVREPCMFPIKRRFRSRFTDFDGVTKGYKWDPTLYLPAELISQAAALQESRESLCSYADVGGEVDCL